MYDESERLLGEYDQAGNLIQEIVWLNDIPVATIRTDQGGSGVGVFYVHTDHLNAPSKITRPSDNAVIWRWDHDPFGNRTPNEDPDGNGLSLVFNLRFPGQYYDQETGLSYNYNRDYDSATGRYVESDPIGLKGGSLSTYTYAGNNPLMYVDPSSLYQCTYSISTHTMSCTPNNPAHQSFSSSEFTAENNQSPSCTDCQKNPDRTSVSNHGPIPTGSYTIGAQLPLSSRRNLTPAPGNQMFGRFAFQIYGCGNAATCSDGCIAATSNQIRELLNQRLSQEDGQNSLQVTQ